MTSMDQVFEEMHAFARELKEFNASMERSCREVELRHGEVDSLWRDSFRKDYDQQWLPLQKEIERYRKKSGPQYQRFLDHKLRALRGYLGRD